MSSIRFSMAVAMALAVPIALAGEGLAQRGGSRDEGCGVFFNPSCAMHNRTVFAVDAEDIVVGVIDE